MGAKTRMTLSNILFRLKSLNDDVELISILILLIFFPAKSSFYYFLVFAILMTVFLVRKIVISKNIGISSFSKALFFINFLFLVSTFFSIYFLNSILFFFDIFLISSYFILHLIEESEEERNINIIGIVISIFSFLSIIIDLIFNSRDLFFSNPIFIGITSGIGVLIFLYRYVNEKNYFSLLLILINLTSLFLAESKAAFIGVSLFSLILVTSKKKKAIPVITIMIVLTLIIPNPIKTMFHYSLKIDPYSGNRVDIWNIGLKIFKANLLTGSGTDNFNELSKKYNFPQKRGPANYFKIPRTAHSDYIKLISELGLLGIFLLFFSLYFIFKRVLTGPIFNISKILVLYLLFQALFFNIIFQTFFFFLFILLLKMMFKSNVEFHSNSKFFRLISISVLTLTIFTGYIFPYYSELLIKKSGETKNITEIFYLLNKAEKFNKLNVSPYYFISTIFLEQFKKSSDPIYFYGALDQVKKIHKINPYFIKAYTLESDIFKEILNKGILYPSLMEKIISPLTKLEFYDPFNPFIKLEKATFLLKFNKPDKARSKAIEALKLEPKFISAIYFLQKNFNYFKKTEDYEARIKTILKDSRSWPEKKSPYLDSLIKLPKELEYLSKKG